MGKIFVTGASGKTGGALARELIAQGRGVRAFVRTRDARSARLEQAGAEIVLGDIFDPVALATAMEGCDRAYYCPPWHPYMIQSATAFAVAARHSGLSTIVHLSQWLASPDNPSLATRQNWLVEELFASLSGIDVITLNPGFFADNYLQLIGMAAQLGVFPWPSGKARNAPPSNEDIARVAAALLADPKSHVGKVYRPTGPDLLSAQEMANIMGMVVGRRVRHVDLPLFMFFKAGRVLGLSAFELSSVKVYIQEERHGAFEFNAPNSHVLDITGNLPESFECTARRYAERPDARQSFTTKLKAIGQFMRIGITPGYDLARLERMRCCAARTEEVKATSTGRRLMALQPAAGSTTAGRDRAGASTGGYARRSRRR